MTVPPFPSQDLAKLVLGYLAEEQLMTAYDEFLQASPYLDALSNEYDRIFMTSLKSILAEYRAVRIYVETCKPHSLRRRLFGCTNLLDVVKFLVQNVDITKINLSQSTHHKTSADNASVSVLSKTTSCEVCASLKLSSCGCKARQTSQQSSNIEESTLESSVETTALEDLPGNQGTTRIKTKGSDKESQSNSSSSSSNDNVEQSSTHGGNVNLSANPQIVNNSSSQCHGVITRKPVQESSQAMPDYSNLRSGDNNVTDIYKNNFSTSTAGSFQEFAKGVDDGANNETCLNIPDSSTSEHTNLIIPINKQASLPSTDNNRSNLREVSNANIFLKVGTVSSLQRESNNMTIFSTPPVLPKILPVDQKVTILSDIKVDKTYVSNDGTDNMPPVLKPATSTPMMQMQTILINGTPVYKQNHQLGKSLSYSTDEIMAMPTIILVPTSAPSKVSSAVHFTSGVHTSNVNPQINQPINARISAISTITQPRHINVNTLKSNQSTVSNILTTVTTMTKTSDEPSVKVLETKNATVPKDVIDFPRTTPETLPPTRKSSSTPRRTSHIRVLDFTTPRRILQETINEQVCDNLDSETIVSKSTNLHTNMDVVVKEVGNKNKKKSIQSANNTPGFVKKSNWDEDLRALACANQNNSTIMPAKPKRKNSKKKQSIDTKDVEDKDVEPVKATAKRKSSTHSSTKSSKCKSKIEIEEIFEEILPAPPVPPVKPTINIISGSDWNTTSPKVEDKQLNKSNNEELIETPDMDRSSLQNAIDTKCNLSNFLETPYKQVFYDLQMETPKFMDINIPFEASSGVKILDIPTPMHLDSPNHSHTPSSYSSRPTDYSSGGSYYKPDHDTLVPDLTPSISKKLTPKNTNSQVCPIENDTKDKTQITRESSRPVRQCTKNVSYYNSPNIKAKETEGNTKQVRACNDTNVNSSSDKTVKETTPKARNKSETNKKKTTTAKKTKQPVRKESTKPFIKIKPRRITPTKSVEKTKKVLHMSEGRKRTSSKENLLTVAPAPTKSRRKSSTPRKLHSTSTSFASESSGQESPETVPTLDNKQNEDHRESRFHDSDNEVPLRWSDEGSQEPKSKEISVTVKPCSDGEDITQIKEYIAKSLETVSMTSENNSELLNDRVGFKGFDIHTAKSIERDLLDDSVNVEDSANIAVQMVQAEKTEVKKIELEVTAQPEDAQSEIKENKSEDEVEEIEIELSVHECNEDTENYIVSSHEETQNIPTRDMEKLKDKFCMEVCLDEDEVIRLRATPFSLLFHEDSRDKEIEAAVNSISNIDKLYTPMKESIRRQVYDIFDSTLTSIDTPLKADSPGRKDVNITVTEIVLQVEKVEEDHVEFKQKSEGKKRKRAQGGYTSDDANDSKRNKQDHILLDSIKNIDIENVLDKLHGE